MKPNTEESFDKDSISIYAEDQEAAGDHYRIGITVTDGVNRKWFGMATDTVEPDGKPSPSVMDILKSELLQNVGEWKHNATQLACCVGCSELIETSWDDFLNPRKCDKCGETHQFRRVLRREIDSSRKAYPVDGLFLTELTPEQLAQPFRLPAPREVPK